MNTVNVTTDLDAIPRLAEQEITDLVDNIANMLLRLHPEDTLTIIAGVMSIPIASESFDDADFARMRQFICTRLIARILDISEQFYHQKMGSIITMPETMQ